MTRHCKTPAIKKKNSLYFLEQSLVHSNFVHRVQRFPINHLLLHVYSLLHYQQPLPPIINQSGLGASHELPTLPMLNFHACKMGERLLGRLNEVIHIDTENSAWQVGVTPIGGLLSASPCTLPHAGRGQGRNPSPQRTGARLAEGYAHNRCSIKTAIRQFDKRHRELWHPVPTLCQHGAWSCSLWLPESVWQPKVDTQPTQQKRGLAQRNQKASNHTAVRAGRARAQIHLPPTVGWSSAMHWPAEQAGAHGVLRTWGQSLWWEGPWLQGEPESFSPQCRAPRRVCLSVQNGLISKCCHSIWLKKKSLTNSNG